MTGDVKDNNGNIDESLLLVSGSKGSKEKDRDYVKKLSNAISQVYLKHEKVKLRCVGAASLNNAIKSFIIASTDAERRDGSVLFLSPKFTTVSFNGDEKTGIVLNVVSE